MMRRFIMKDASDYIARHVRDLPKSGIREFFAVAEQNPNAISLGVGEPDFVTPWQFREAAIFALERGKTSYTNNLGQIGLRREISAYVEREFQLEYNPETEIIVSVGVSEALDAGLRALLNPGDKVLYHEPCYVSYSPSVALAYAEAIPVTTYAKDAFALTVESLEAAWEPGCKALMLNFPTNPTGGIINRGQVEKIAKFCVDKDLIVFSDEIYAELTFEGEHVSIATLPGMRERTLFFHGVSKAFAMTGFRLGYACGPAPFIDAILKVHQYAIMCAPILSQYAATVAFRDGKDSVLKMKESYHRRRDYLVRRFNEIGLPCHLPKATFYTFPQVDVTGKDERSFAIELLQKEEVAIVPGTAFGASGKGFCRACFATSYERLIEATARIEKYVNGLKG